MCLIGPAAVLSCPTVPKVKVHGDTNMLTLSFKLSSCC